ncbi:acyltransferase family protein [Occallatibacter riparius]|uniref:Acyltransferase n=1 Tax=Occallatibacter riparius TaxID=1002689 RepID=A0A9J7BXX8_9BACT|nr:acyltransferase [Occallatibacter riparius]UWZ86141.1 acyltransferase [Occallatibacter riparius]
MEHSRGNQLYSLQYLRAIAAIGVVLVHASTTLQGREGGLPLFRAGSYGVDLFFVISGFVMFYTTAEKPITPGRFLVRRCIRVVPIYFLLTTFGFALALLAPRLTNLFSASPRDYLRSIFFIPYFNPAFNDIRPEVQQGWTLNYEMFFYAVFASCLWLKERHRLIVCTSVLIVLAAIGIVASPSGVFAKTYTDPILLEFTFGMVISWILLRRRLDFPHFVIALVAAAVAAISCVLWLGVSHRTLFAGVPAAAIVGTVILLEQRGLLPCWPLLLLIGDSSYSLYLVHTFILATLKRIFVHVPIAALQSSPMIFMIFGLVGAVLFAMLFYRAVEAPLNRRLQLLIARKGMTSVSPPAAAMERETRLRAVSTD